MPVGEKNLWFALPASAIVTIQKQRLRIGPDKRASLYLSAHTHGRRWKSIYPLHLRLEMWWGSDDEGGENKCRFLLREDRALSIGSSGGESDLRRTGMFAGSIIRPDAWSGEFQQVGIRTPEIQTGTASPALNFRFNLDSTLAQSRSPSLERVRGNGKGEVARAACLMRRDDASGNDDRIIRPALSEEQQHIRTSPQGAEALVADHGLKIEQQLIEFTRAMDLRDIDAGLDDSIHPQIRALDWSHHFQFNNTPPGRESVNGVARRLRLARSEVPTAPVRRRAT